MVDALTRIHAALLPGGVLVDTQPVGSRWPVAVAGEQIGELESDEWLATVAAVDAESEKALAAGRYELRHEKRYAVVHQLDSGRELLEEVSTWAGTRIPEGVAVRLQQATARATVEHDVRLRLLHRP